MSHLTDQAGKSVSKAEARQALKSALQSPGFSSSPQLSDFLRYIVEKAIAGNAVDIKAYSIAVDALGKGEDFDPQENAAVRVAAGRLRQALKLHNAESARTGAPLMIKLEAGSYVPVFESRETEAVEADATTVPIDAIPAQKAEQQVESVETDQNVDAAKQGNTPQMVPVSIDTPVRTFRVPRSAVALVLVALCAAVLVGSYFWAGFNPRGSDVETDSRLRPALSASLVLPDKKYPEWFASNEVADSVAITLSRFDSYEFSGVVTASKQSQPTEDAADYRLVVSAYDNAGAVRIFVQLMRGRDGVVLWSTQKLFLPPPTDKAHDVPQIAGRILAPLLSPYGVVFNDLRNGGADRFALRCFIAAYQYFYSKSDEGHARARDCSEELREGGSNLPTIYAALTYLYLDEHRESRNRRERDPLEAARRMAARAVELGPLSAQAHQAEFAVHKVSGHRAAARKSGRTAVELNPYNTDILSDYAAWLISIGDAQNGREFLEKAVSMLQSKPAWVDFYRFLGAELTQDLDVAAEISLMMDITRSPLLAAAVAIGSHRRGAADETQRALAELKRSEPAMIEDPKSAFMRRGFDESIAELLAEKLFEAGLPQSKVAKAAE